jgi:hypothetical protein
VLPFWAASAAAFFYFGRVTAFDLDQEANAASAHTGAEGNA